MYRCEAPNCKMRTYNLSEEQLKLAKNNYIVSFHKFPDDPDKRKAWIEAASRKNWDPPEFSSLCSLHFRDDCFNDSNELYDHALPTIFFDDFRSHIRSIVIDFDLDCGFSDDGSDNSNNVGELIEPQVNDNENNPNKVSSDADEDDVSIIECEEIMEFEEDDGEENIGIENIPISESNKNDNLTITKSVDNAPSSSLLAETVSTSDLELILSSPTSTPVPPLVFKPKSPPQPELVPASKPSSFVTTKTLIVPVTATKLQPTSIAIANPAKISKPNVSLISTSSITKGATVSKPLTTPAFTYKPAILSRPKVSPISSTKSSILSQPQLSQSLVTKPTPVSKPTSTPVSDMESMIVCRPKTTQVVAKTIPTSLSKPTAAISKPQFTPSTSQLEASKQIIKKVSLHTTPILQKISEENLIPLNSKINSKHSVAEKVDNTSNDGDDDEVICIDDIEASSNQSVGTESGTDCGVKNECNTKHLFALLKPASLNKYLIDEPASRNLVLQLLNIVKLANIPNENKGASNLPSTFIITTKIEDKNVTNEEIKVMESTTVIHTITSLLKHYKAGRFLKPKNISLICGSPAIFFMKYVSVKNCDPDMNSIYIITNENLLPVLFQHRVKDKLNYRYKKQMMMGKTVGAQLERDQKVGSIDSGDIEVLQSNKSTSRTSVGSYVMSNSRLTSTSGSSSTTVTKPTPSQYSNTKPPISGKSGSSTSQFTNTKSLLNATTSSISVTTVRPSIGVGSSKATSTVSKPPTTVAPVARVIPSSFTSPNSYQPVNRIQSSPKSTSAFSKPLSDTFSRYSNNLGAVESIASTSFDATDKSKSRPSISSVVKDFFVSSGFPSSHNSSPSTTEEYTFQPIRAEIFDTGLTQSPQSLRSCSPIASTSRTSLKRSWPQEYDEDDDEDVVILNSPRHDIDKQEYAYEQQKEIEVLEHAILQKEREIDNLKKKFQLLKKRLNDVSNSYDNKTDDQLIEDILSKYIDSDGVQFFIGQMKVAGKTYTQFRWSEEDKLFALGLLYKNPVEYNILFQKYTLPSDKTLNKFVTRIKKAEMSDTKDDD